MADWTHFGDGHISETDTSPEPSPQSANHCQSETGVSHWIVELGRVDIIAEVSILASHMALPREGHLEAVFHLFAHVKNHHNARSIFDPTCPEIDKSNFQEHDWKDFYGGVKEAIPPDAPTALGEEVDPRMCIDSDLASDEMMR